MSTSTPLYQEAIIEVKKLREIAKKDAERTILEKMSSTVDQMINREMSGVPIIFEQDEDPTLTAPPVGGTPALPAPAPGAMAAAPQMPATAPMDSNIEPPAGDLDMSAMPAPGATPDAALPVSPLPADAAPIADSSLGGATVGLDGKYVVDIEALFAATPEGSEPNISGAAMTPSPLGAATATAPALAPVGGAPAPTAEMPPAAPPVAGAEALPGLEGEPVAATEEEPVPLAEMFKNSVNSLEKEVNKEMSSSKLLSETKIEVLQNKIFTLYEMAQKAKISKDISRAAIANGEIHMEFMFAKLKESAKQANSYNRQSTIKEETMAKKEFKTLKEFAVSLFAEEVEAKGHSGFDAGHAKEDVINSNESDKASNHAEKASKSTPVADPGKAESLKIGGAAVAESVEEGDESAMLENELMEMLGSMEEEGVQEEGAPVMEAKAITKKLKALKEEQAKLMKALKECGTMGEVGGNVNDPSGVKITISVDSGAGDVAVSGLEGGLEGSGDGDEDDSFEIVPDEEGEESSLHASGEEEEGSEEDSSSEEEEEEEEKGAFGGSMVAESKVSKENKKLRAQLAETQLLTARSLFVSKLFAEHNLSTGTKQKIVEYIDSAQTVEEAKTKFGRVKKMLEEAAKPTRRTTGTSSKPSAVGAPVINESASPIMNLSMSPNRWMHLAGISKKSV